MRLSLALFLSALLHLGLALWVGWPPTATSVATPGTTAVHQFSARLIPPASSALPPPPPAPAPVVKAAAQTRRQAASDAPKTPTHTTHTTRPNRGPRPLGPIKLDIPEAMLPTVQGRLVMKLWVDEQGQVVAFEAEPTELPTEYVTAVGEALTEVRFAPAQQEGHPVPGIFRIEVNTEPAEPPAN